MPLSEVPPEEQIPAFTLIGAAYGFVWVVLIGYVWSLGRRLQKPKREIDLAGAAEALTMDVLPGLPTAAHFIYIPVVVLLGSWSAGSRLAPPRTPTPRNFAAVTAHGRTRQAQIARSTSGRARRIAEFEHCRLVPAVNFVIPWSQRPGEALRQDLGQAFLANAHLRLLDGMYGIRVERHHATRSTTAKPARGSPSRGWPTDPGLIR